MSQTPAAHACQCQTNGSRSPTPTQAAFVKVPRVIGPRPLRSQHVPRRGPILAAPKAVHPLPTWLTHFEDYEDELLAEFCPPSKISSPRNPGFPVAIVVGLHTGRMFSPGHNPAFEVCRFPPGLPQYRYWV